ncbi:MAG: DegT/DnrJ/EryC1/StrS family aminotransferase [Leptolyngbya sp. SIO3F4]|nr:DegT/DnrJ/EryC1/StrS family aminotransferase [Leptolyngbya sp. SIO3F4]
MDAIRMVDLKKQYDRIKTEVDEAVIRVLESTAFINGPEVREFQRELEQYLDVKHVIPCANGTDALQIALMAAGIQPGDEVITPSFTYVATCEVVALLGAKPVFVDVHPDTFNIDVNTLDAKVGPKTKAIIPVHLYGQCADMEPVLQWAKKHRLKVIEDTAQGIGADYTFSDGSTRKAGTMGDIGCTSFFPSKNLGCYGDGGAIFTNDDHLAEQMRMIANHGQSKRYYHDQVGVNSRLDSIQAAVLRIKLRHLNEYNEARQAAAAAYSKAFSVTDKITTPFIADFSTHVFHQYTMRLHGVDRAGLQEHLHAKDIPTNIYYPLANHRQEAYSGISDGSDLPVTELLSTEVLSLPIHTELSADQLEYITSAVLEYIQPAQ